MGNLDNDRRALLEAIKLGAQARFLAVRGRAMHGADLGGFVERGTDVSQCRRRLALVSGAEQGQILALEGMQARFDAAVMGLFAGAVPHATFR